jgi:hypothetical protein
MAANALRIPITALDKTGAAFSSVSRGLGQIGVNVAKLTVAFGTLGVAAGAAIVRNQMKAIDALGKTADKIGVTTEALGAMRHAADLTGVSTSTMDMALQRFVRRTSEAARGTGEARGALQELGLSAGDLSRLPLDEAMQQVADAMQGVGSQSDRVRLAMKLFDSEGVSLLQTLKGGSAGLKEMADEAEALGILLSRADVAQVEAANDALTRSAAIFDGLAAQFTVAIAPFVEEVANQMRQAALDTEDFGNMGFEAARSVVKGVAAMINTLMAVPIFLKKGEIAWEQFKLTALQALDYGGAISNAVDGINFLRRALGQDEVTNPIAEGVADITSNIEVLRGELALLGTPSAMFDDLLAKLEGIEAGARRRAEAIAKETAETQKQKDATEKLTFAKTLQLKGQEELAKFNAQSSGEQAATVIGNMKTMFAKSKAFNIADAIMNTYKGATLALSSYPPPLNGIMAAATIASGMAQVAQIRAQSFEGGGFTGRGARSGGMDGKGGFMAMLHPNESVIDHTKGQGQGVTIINNIDATGADASVDMKIRQAMKQSSEQTVLTIQDLMRRRRFV